MGLTGGLASNGANFPGQTFRVKSQTATAGVAAINGTQTTLTWTAPNDGQLHTVLVTGMFSVTGATETGGLWNVTCTLGGLSFTSQLLAAAKAVGQYFATSTVLCDPNTTVSVVQSSALTNAGTSNATTWQSLMADA